MLGMLTSLKGAALYVAGAIVLAAIGAATYLASRAVLTGSDWLVVVTSVLAGVVGVTSAHVAGQTAAAAINIPPPGPTSPPAPLTVPAEEPAAHPAMPGG